MSDVHRKAEQLVQLKAEHEFASNSPTQSICIYGFILALSLLMYRLFSGFYFWKPEIETTVALTILILSATIFTSYRAYIVRLERRINYLSESLRFQGYEVSSKTIMRGIGHHFSDK